VVLRCTLWLWALLLLYSCGPVTAVALLQNNTDLLGLVRRDGAPVTAPAPAPPKKENQQEENHEEE
jgi:hypothetical protein